MAKRPSRAQERQRLFDAAARVQVPSDCDVIVVGGGAAGLVAAITAAEAGAEVLVLDRDLECGRPILATGNGRCNFSNVNLDPKRFNDPQFVEAVCGDRWLDDILAFFRESGLRWCLEDERLYPMSRSSASVRNVLLARAKKAGVILAPAREVVGIDRIDTTRPGSTERRKRQEVGVEALGMSVEVACTEPSSNYPVLPNAQAVVIASGGEALPALLDVGLVTARRTPVLCPVACDAPFLRQLDGRRAHAQAYLTKRGSFFPTWHERGEVLFRDYGLSGIVTFDLSRRVEAGDLVKLDLAPDLTKSQVQQLVDPFASGSFEPGCLDGVLDPQVARVLEDLACQRWHIEWPERPMPETDAAALIGLVKALPLVATGLADTNHAQVTRGGLLTKQFDPTTLASREHEWLFACGEALDVDADCGGFNLSWAWKSGMVAGASAAKLALSRRGFA